jgi:hypothetical protein
MHLLIKSIDQPYVQKSRPVSLTNILRRIFEKLVLKRISNEPWAILHPNQAGFRVGWSTTTQILINDELSRTGYPISVYLDLKAAFDTVDHNYLIQVLLKRKCPDNIIWLIHSLMMQDCRSFISVNHSSSTESIVRSRGLFQGSILSPILFNMVIDELAHDICLHRPEVKLLLFADDIALKANDWSQMQAALDICLSWSKKAHLEWGIPKCGLVSKDIPLQTLNIEQDLPIVKSYKYLGIPMKYNGIDWTSYLDHTIKKFHNLIKATQMKKMEWTYAHRIIIYQTFIRPTLEYCLPILSKWLKKQGKDANTAWKSLNDCHVNGMEWIFDRRRPIHVLESLAGLGSLAFRIEQLEASLRFHLDQIHQANPLKAYLENYTLSTNKNSIISIIKKSQLHSQWLKYKKEEKFPVKYKTWLKKEKLQSIQESSGILQHYIRNRCRNKSGMDMALKQGFTTSKIIVSWRCNTCFLNATCPTCFEPFTRGHVIKCPLIELAAPDHLKTWNLESYWKEVTKIEEEIGKEIHGYSILDFYCNNQDYEQFKDLFLKLHRLLYGDMENNSFENG